MRIVDFLRPELVVPDLQERDKLGVLGALVRQMVDHVPGIDGAQLLKVLVDRERLASTAIGEGVAIPHGKLPTISRLEACLGRSVEGVDFESMDGRPTHVFFLLVAPDRSTSEHLKALARISRLFKDPQFRVRLLAAKSGPDLYKVIADEDARY